MTTSYVDAGAGALTFDFSLARHETPFDYPSPPSSSSSDSPEEHDHEEASTSELPKKKRKAWGQPVPEIVPILPPRKRAKTSEEKEQRKNERILRNRRAADKSRQRQKAAQADLETTNKRLSAENAYLKQFLEQHGLLSQVDFDFKTSTPETISLSTPAPSTVSQSRQHSVCNESYDQNFTSTPVLVPDATHPIPKLESPTLAPTLDLEGRSTPTLVPDNGLTQYPAAILCDLQCQPVLNKKLESMMPTSKIYTLLTYIHFLTTVLATTTTTTTSTTQSIPSSTSTAWQMSQVFQILEQTLATASHHLESIVLNNFELMHILISMPSTTTQPAVFRLKVLSRLLSCNPCLAPLMMMAADKALQEKFSSQNDSHWTASPESRWTVASLMTIKWSIRWLEQQHSGVRTKIRTGVKFDRSVLQERGVDCGGVERYYRLFDKIDPAPSLVVVAS